MAQEGPQTSGSSTNAPTGSNGCGVNPTHSFPFPNGISCSVQLTIRLLMQSRDVGSIIGKGGATVSKFRQDSSAHINITDGGNERIVTLTGPTENIFAAFRMICQKVEEVCIGYRTACEWQPIIRAIYLLQGTSVRMRQSRVHARVWGWWLYRLSWACVLYLACSTKCSVLYISPWADIYGISAHGLIYRKSTG